ncbi:ABC transporter substrate-binding protein [Actinomadura harenae]|uniref:ABC transporter substrate-binding protein n=1 Tax=Actinomadura harenae TaxID=2483351 RepID=A0A3M2MBS0_9ACTN|nr:ABC transporter substrate-binding protein [Actinomadura harenae]RMI47057.1 ABC transporter substrate-binding protein [Actinomadura harenae]
MTNLASSHLSRRGLLGAGGALALGAVLTACGGGRDGTANASDDGGAWSFTDDRGQKAEAASRPRRVVAYVGAAAALWDFGVTDRIVGVYGPARLKDGGRDPQVGDVDISKVEIIGNAYGEFNIEKYAALRPELLVDHMFVKPNLFYVPAESKDKIFKLAPGVGVQTGDTTLTTPIEHYAALAVALGADLRSPANTAAKNRFDKAVTSLRLAAAANKGLRVLAASASPNLFYASSPAKNADLRFLKDLGVEVIAPGKLDQAGYFESLSWENADKYKADVILLDARTQALQPKDLGSRPSWGNLPAVKADQVFAWEPEPRFSYAGCAPIIERLAETVKNAKKVA